MQAVMSSHFPETIAAETKLTPKGKKSPLQKLPTLSELFSLNKKERKHEMAGGEVRELPSCYVLNVVARTFWLCAPALNHTNGERYQPNLP